MPRSATDIIASQRAIEAALDRGETPRLRDHIPMGEPGPMTRTMERVYAVKNAQDAETLQYLAEYAAWCAQYGDSWQYTGTDD